MWSMNPMGHGSERDENETKSSELTVVNETNGSEMNLCETNVWDQRNEADGIVVIVVQNKIDMKNLHLINPFNGVNLSTKTLGFLVPDGSVFTPRYSKVIDQLDGKNNFGNNDMIS